MAPRLSDKYLKISGGFESISSSRGMGPLEIVRILLLVAVSIALPIYIIGTITYIISVTVSTILQLNHHVCMYVCVYIIYIYKDISYLH